MKKSSFTARAVILLAITVAIVNAFVVFPGSRDDEHTPLLTPNSPSPTPLYSPLPHSPVPVAVTTLPEVLTPEVASAAMDVAPTAATGTTSSFLLALATTTLAAGAALHRMLLIAFRSAT